MTDVIVNATNVIVNPPPNEGGSSSNGVVRLSDYCAFDGSDERTAVSAAIADALEQNATLVGAPVECGLGTATNNDTLFTIPQTDGFTFHGEGIKFVFDCDTYSPEIFKFVNPSRLTVDGISLQDTGTGSPSVGSRFVSISAEGAQQVYNRIRFRDIFMDNGLILFTSTGDTSSTSNPSRTGARFEDVVFEGGVSNSFYGIVTYNNLDFLTTTLHSKNVGRTYFPYGARNHNVNLFVHNDGSGPQANQAVLVDSDQIDTVGVKINAMFSGSLADHNYAVGFQIKAASGSKQCRGIDVFADFSNVTTWGSCVPFVLWAFDQNQQIKTTTGDFWDDILIDANLRNAPANLDWVFFHSHPTTAGKMWLGPRLNGYFYPTYKPYINIS